MLRPKVHLPLIKSLLRSKAPSGSDCHSWFVFCEKHRVEIVGSHIHHTILVIYCIKRRSDCRSIFSNVEMLRIFNIRRCKWVSIIRSLRIISLLISTICVFNLHSATEYLGGVLFVTELLNTVHLDGMILPSSSLRLLTKVAAILRIKSSSRLVW